MIVIANCVRREEVLLKVLGLQEGFFLSRRRRRRSPQGKKRCERQESFSQLCEVCLPVVWKGELTSDLIKRFAPSEMDDAFRDKCLPSIAWPIPLLP